MNDLKFTTAGDYVNDTNSRIQELAEQAGLKYHNWITNESNVNDGDFKYPRLEDYKKFAELIVRECGIVADQWVNDEDNGTNLVSAKLRQHFGVAE